MSAKSKRTLKSIQSRRKPLVPLKKIDAMLEEIGHSRRAISHYKQNLRAVELQLYRISGYHRHTQRRPGKTGDAAKVA